LRYAIDRILSTTEITPEVHDLFRGAQIVAVKLALEEKPGHEEAHRAFHAMYPNRFLLRVVDPDAVYERIPPSIYIQ
jgi:N-acetyl-gamma-glutamylphosphate reductase